MLSGHGGELFQAALRLGVDEAQLLDASASLVPWSPRLRFGVLRSGLRNYPDRQHQLLRLLIARLHSLDLNEVLPGNGAAELFTWAARDAVGLGRSLCLAPGFVDYWRALQTLT